MSNNIFSKEIIDINNFISLNPTGIITLSEAGSFKMNGPPSKIMTAEEKAKQNLNNVNSNTFICNQNQSKIENFENYNSDKKLYKNLDKKSNKNIFIYFILVLFLLLIILLFIYKKKKI
jgi:hypothetical protein